MEGKEDEVIDEAEEEETEEDAEDTLAIIESVVIQCRVGHGTPPEKEAASVAIFVT